MWSIFLSHVSIRFIHIISDTSLKAYLYVVDYVSSRYYRGPGGSFLLVSVSM